MGAVAAVLEQIDARGLPRRRHGRGRGRGAREDGTQEGGRRRHALSRWFSGGTLPSSARDATACII